MRFQPIQRRIERALFDEQAAARDLLDAQQDAVAVLRAERDRLKDQQIQRSGKEWERGMDS